MALVGPGRVNKQRRTNVGQPKGGGGGGRRLSPERLDRVDPLYQRLGHDVPLGGSWQQRGFESPEAAQSVRRQYGLVQQPGGGFAKPTMDWFTQQMETAGYGPQFQAQSLNEAGTPVNIGGARWMMGKNGLDFTGQVAGGGAPYNAGGGGRPPVSGPRTIRDFAPPPGAGGGGGPQPFPGPGPGGISRGGGGGRRQFGAGGAGGLGFPPVPPAPPAFLPMTPQFESGRRAGLDQLTALQANVEAGQGVIDPLIQLQLGRLGTDERFANQGLLENMANRGLVGSGVYPELYQRDIGIPYGRARQDLALSGAQQYGGLAQQLGAGSLDFNNLLAELLLNRASDVASDMPLSLPQFYGGGRQKARGRARKTGGRSRGKSKGRARRRGGRRK